MDTVGVGGMSAPALRFDAPGVTVWAIQTAYDAYGDSLHPSERPDLWAATGDSLRFHDGTLIPMKVGALRALDSIGVIVIDHGDDGTGSYIVRCKFPALAIIINNVWPSFARIGAVPFSRASAADPTKVWRVEIESRQTAKVARRACPRVSAT
jgi:hypothetical protein